MSRNRYSKRWKLFAQLLLVGAIALVLSTGNPLASDVLSDSAMSRSTHYYWHEGELAAAINVSVYDNYYGDYSKYQWVYSINNINYDPYCPILGCNGFSGIVLYLDAVGFYELADQQIPAGWLTGSQYPYPVNWDILSSDGFLPGEGGTFSFTTIPRETTTIEGYFNTRYGGGAPVEAVYFDSSNGPDGPGAQLPTGACCFTDGSCNQLTAEQCGNAGGAFWGENASCVGCPDFCSHNAECDDGDPCTGDFCVNGFCFNKRDPGCGDIQIPNCPDPTCIPDDECQVAVCIDTGSSSICITFDLPDWLCPPRRDRPEYVWVPEGQADEEFFQPPLGPVQINTVVGVGGIMGGFPVPFMLSPFPRLGSVSMGENDFNFEIATDPGCAWKLDFMGELSKLATIKFTYPEADLKPGIDESDLAIYKMVDGGWIRLGGVIDVEENTITIDTDDFSFFVLGSGYPFTVAAELLCTPATGTLPITTLMSARLTNCYPDQSRRIAGRIDVLTASGSNYSHWRAGWTNVDAASSHVSSWNQSIPALGSVVGDNLFSLLAEDVSPAPYNQPPYPSAGDTDISVCTVTGIAP